MQPEQQRRGFTLIEVLVVIIIIGVLMAILIPVIGKVRVTAQTANSEAFLAQLARAIEDYHADHRAYPGPLTNVEVWNDQNAFGAAFNNVLIDPQAQNDGFAVGQGTNFRQKVTMSENLVLGLLGGLRVQVVGTNNFNLVYDPRLVGGGANSLGRTGANKRHKAYLEPANLSWRGTDPTRQPGPADPSPGGLKTGQYLDDSGRADDTIIPEFQDRYTEVMPILYMRGRSGALAVTETPVGTATEDNNGIVTYDKTDTNNRSGHYDLHQIRGYVFPVANQTIGVGKKNIDYYANSATPIATPAVKYHGLGGDPTGTNSDPNPQAVLGPPGQNYYYPYNAYPYLRNHSLSGKAPVTSPVPHNKGGFILISAGADRIYGTQDDLTNFGGVGK
jgi:prepilin-type N-terminal cleavage/methylation domain-containing protein